MITAADARQLLINQIDREAEWRGMKAEEYPEDGRNELHMRNLKAFADYVRGLADSDPRLKALAASLLLVDGMGREMWSLHGWGGDGRVAYRIGEHLFHTPKAGEDWSNFLNDLVLAAKADRREYLREFDSRGEVR